MRVRLLNIAALLAVAAFLAGFWLLFLSALARLL